MIALTYPFVLEAIFISVHPDETRVNRACARARAIESRSLLTQRGVITIITIIGNK